MGETESLQVFKMVGFSKTLREVQASGWEPYYINYKMMKKKLNRYVQIREISGEERLVMRKEFARLLDWQIEKVVLFLLEQQGHLAARLAVLGDVRDAIKDSGDPSHISSCVEAYQAVGMDLLKLLHFLEINATGIRKILKKFDKRVAYRITDYYVATRSKHPYSQLHKVFRHVGIEAMVGTLGQSLAELKHPTRSIYDDPVESHLEDPIIHSIHVAEEQLINSTNFLHFMANHALIEREVKLPSSNEKAIGEQFHYMSLILNLMNAFFYMVNTYIVVPTADKYAKNLGAAPTLCGVIIGSMAVAQLVSSIYFSAWSNKSYFQPLVFSSAILLLGNILYAVAYDAGSLSILIIGRIFCGLGSARAVNRRYISDWVPVKNRLQASAAFVTASALGMAAGPALAGAFQVHASFLGLTVSANTLPGWTMAACWLFYLFSLWIGFKEPAQNKHAEDIQDPARADVNSIIIQDGQLEDGIFNPLLKSDDDEDNEKPKSKDYKGSNKPAKSLVEAYKLLTTPVKVQLLIYFMLKYAMEILLSESSVITAYYFDWSTTAVALFLGLLGLTTLPVNYIVGSYISNMFEDRQILFVSEFITCLGVIVCFVGPMPYTVVQYISGSLITFVSAEVLEGVNLSLLSKVMSSRLAQGTYNNGLLSTEAGTLARVVADATITLAGYLGTSLLLNVTLAPTLFIGILSLIATSYTYNSLF